MKMDKAHFIAFVGVMFALMFVLGMLEGFMQSGLGMTAIILTLPLAIALSVYDNWKMSFLGGTMLGIVLCIFCLTSSLFLKYANPLIAILPRMLIGVASYWVSFGLTKLFANSNNKFVCEVLPYSLAGAVGAIVNTSLYLLSIYIWKDWLGESAIETLDGIVAVLAIIYFFVEIVASIVLVPVYVKVLKKFNKSFIYKKQNNINI